MPVDEVRRQDVLDILEPLYRSKPETGKAVRTILRQVFGRAAARELVTTNPAGEGINGGLPSRRAGPKAHFLALHYSEVASALRKVEGSGAFLATRLAVRCMALTAARGAEVRGMTWDEVDLEALRCGRYRPAA